LIELFQEIEANGGTFLTGLTSVDQLLK